MQLKKENYLGLKAKKLGPMLERHLWSLHLNPIECRSNLVRALGMGKRHGVITTLNERFILEFKMVPFYGDWTLRSLNDCGLEAAFDVSEESPFVNGGNPFMTTICLREAQIPTSVRGYRRTR